MATITEIQGKYGLTQDSNDTPFQDLEESVLTNVSKYLDERQSIADETNAAKGFGRSTFHDQAEMQQQTDVISKVQQEFAQTRLQDELAKRQMERDITKADVGTQLEKERMREAQAIDQEQYKTQSQIYADKNLSDQLNLFKQEQDALVKEIDAKFDAGEYEDDAQYYSAKQNAINSVYAKQKASIDTAVKDEKISTMTAYDRSTGLIKTQYEEQAKNTKEQAYSEMEKMFGANVIMQDEKGNDILNPEFKGELAERYWYSYQLDKNTLETQYEAEKLKANATFSTELLNTLLGTKDMDVFKGASIYTLLTGIPGLQDFLGVSHDDLTWNDPVDPTLKDK